MSYLELNNLTKEFDSVRAVDNLSLSIAKGEFISLLGASGCGKTTTLRMVAGFTKQTGGEIFLDGKNITNLPAGSRNMGMVFQSYALFPTLTVYENICFGLRVRKKSHEFIERKVHQLLDLGHLEGLEQRYPAQLSGGQQQRVALLRALAIEPVVLLLDEPLSNLDAKLRVEIRKEIRRMQSLLNITTLYVTHDQEEALAVSDRIAVMDRGIVLQTGNPLEIYLKPANKFVSDFIGRSNLITCELVGSNRLRLGEALFTLPLPEWLASKSSLVLSFRPQYVDIHEAAYQPAEDFNGIAIKAKFFFETFLGTAFQIEAVTTEGQTIMVEIPLEQRRRMDLKTNDPLLLTISADHIHIYDG